MPRNAAIWVTRAYFREAHEAFVIGVEDVEDDVEVEVLVLDEPLGVEQTLAETELPVEDVCEQLAGGFAELLGERNLRASRPC